LAAINFYGTSPASAIGNGGIVVVVPY